MAILDVLMRFIHIVSAVLAVGGAFLMLVGVPAGLGLIDDPAKRQEVLLRIRRAFKMTVHPAILGLLVSGIYNTIRLWPTYKLNMGRHHMFWGPHLLLGLAIIGISLWLLAGKSLRNNHRKWLKINLTLMLVTILLASALRYVRLSTVAAAWDADKKKLESLSSTAGPATNLAPTPQPAGTQPTGAPAATQRSSAGAVAPNSIPSSDDNNLEKTKVLIRTIEGALDLFEQDTGRYPSQTEGLSALVTSPAGANNWRGPYLKTAAFADAWGTPLLYRYPGAHNKHGPDLQSLGGDRKDGGNDDIGNWAVGPTSEPSK